MKGKRVKREKERKHKPEIVQCFSGETWCDHNRSYFFKALVVDVGIVKASVQPASGHSWHEENEFNKEGEGDDDDDEK